MAETSLLHLSPHSHTHKIAHAYHEYLICTPPPPPKIIEPMLEVL